LKGIRDPSDEEGGRVREEGRLARIELIQKYAQKPASTGGVRATRKKKWMDGKEWIINDWQVESAGRYRIGKLKRGRRRRLYGKVGRSVARVALYCTWEEVE